VTGLAYEEAPLRLFHLRVAAASTGGVFSDGFGLGIIGISLNVAAPQLHLSPLWLGSIGGASLAGLFLGALVTGPFADRVGRRGVFAGNMLALGAFAALQFWASSGAQLLLLRLAIGFVLGTDYVVSKSLLTEFTPRRLRGTVLSLLSVAWAAGYASAYAVGQWLASGGANAWHWMLLSSAVPCLAVLPLRITMPESPLWLVDHGRDAEAAAVVRAKLGAAVRVPEKGAVNARGGGRWRQLLSAAWRRRTLVACVFFTCQVIPYFAVGTFVADVISALDARGGATGGLIYNGALLLGAVAGVLTIDRLPRRRFLLGSFVLPAAALLALIALRQPPPAVIVGLFALFAGVLSAASNLVYVYLPELFPTDLRASGIGLAVACSRIGSAVSTFLLPVVVAGFGVRVALGVCALVLLAGAAVCQRWAPETRHATLTRVAPVAGAPPA
jgi:MFS transporter, putative metabolite transport protein